VYVNNNEDSNLYGLEPNFGCCTANMHQGWPKFTSHAWMRTSDGGLVALTYAPCSVHSVQSGKDVRVTVETEYPFNEVVTIQVSVAGSARFPLELRIPEWARGAEVHVGQDPTARPSAGTLWRIDRTWEDTTQVQLRLPMQARLWPGFRNSVAIARGPLVYAFRITESWRKLKGTEPFADWEVFPKAPWNYALLVDREHPERSIAFEERGVGAMPFSPSGAPVVARVLGRALPWWTLEKNAASPPPESPVRSSEPIQELELLPYGCTSLRVTEFPTLNE
jgi:hypothetical protein